MFITSVCRFKMWIPSLLAEPLLRRWFPSMRCGITMNLISLMISPWVPSYTVLHLNFDVFAHPPSKMAFHQENGEVGGYTSSIQDYFCSSIFENWIQYNDSKVTLTVKFSNFWLVIWLVILAGNWCLNAKRAVINSQKLEIFTWNFSWKILFY